MLHLVSSINLLFLFINRSAVSIPLTHFFLPRHIVQFSHSFIPGLDLKPVLQILPNIVSLPF